MLVGYARVSTDDQDLTLQRAALKEEGANVSMRRKSLGRSVSAPN
jgi:DNA invertase Pin-like site-specific DNA recombinase